MSAGRCFLKAVRSKVKVLNKKELRRLILSRRESLSTAEVEEKSRAITFRLLAMPVFQQAKTVMAYIQFRREVQTTAIIAAALQAGKRVAVPVTDTVGKRLIPSLLCDPERDLAPGAYGILEPKPEAIRPLVAGEIDLVLVPGVVFDLHCNRIGYGGGYYDRFLPSTGKNCCWLALAFELQLVERIPVEEFDLPVHMVVTEERVLVREG